jgi:DMSO/TMAO reductase YedYZ molybdopterin-dependent catalytic subunit
VNDTAGSATGRADTAARWPGALAGLVAAVVGLAVAELATALDADLRSPVLDVGDRVIDASPSWLTSWAIDVFGTNDKAVLLVGVAVVVALGAAGLGVLAFRRGPAPALVGIGIFAVLGAAASIGGSAGATGVLPSLLGGVAAAATLLTLCHLDGRAHSGASGAGTSGTAPVAEPMRRPGATRRQFLGASGLFVAGAGAVALTGRWLHQSGVAAAERLRVVLPRPSKPLAPVPAGVGLDVPGLSPFLTPNDDFYRIDTALRVPSVDPREWTLTVEGERTLTLTYDELLARPMVEVDITLACVSNEVGGDLVGTARWLGCRLDDLLEEAGIPGGADQVMGTSVDGFTAGFPVAALDGRDALVAVGMNGEPLPALHGFPARIVVPGLYGYVSAVKWLRSIELTTFDAEQGYWIPRGWAVEGPIKTQSRIDTPSAGATVDAGRTPVAGVAWAPTIGIEAVEVRVDDGPWTEARLGEEYVDTTWRQWVWEWDATPGRHRLEVRATDADGVTQTEQRTEVAPDGASGWHSVSVEVRG